MPAKDMPILCIPAECDNIKSPFGGEIASRWDACLLCDICRHFASVMFHFASLISHNLRCIPAYAHQIPMGFFTIITNYMTTGTTCISFQFFMVMPYFLWVSIPLRCSSFYGCPMGLGRRRGICGTIRGGRCNTLASSSWCRASGRRC